MAQMYDLTRVMMERALEEACRKLPNGGSHEARAFVASRLLVATHKGTTTLGELAIVARKALADFETGRWRVVIP